MSISISLADRRFRISNIEIKRLLEEVLARESAAGSSINVVYCGDREMVRLNREFKGKNSSTDVLAFDLSDVSDDSLSGEIYVNLQIARRQALENHVAYRDEVKRITIHGVLHLLGYRDNTAGNRKRMWARQESYLQA